MNGLGRSFVGWAVIAGKARFALAMLLGVQVAGASEAFHIPLQIDAGGVAPGTQVPMYVGVPFAPGRVGEAGEVRLVDAHGAEVPAQTRVLARWPQEGSVRWLGVHFQGDPAQPYHVERGAARPLTRGITRQRTDAGDLIQTGAAQFLVPSRGPLLAGAWLDLNGDGRFTENERILRNTTGDDLYVIDAHGREATLGRDDAPQPLQWEAPEAGPALHATIRREGWYVTEGGEKLARTITRLHFMADQPFVRLEHTLVLTEDAENVRFREIGLRLRHVLADADRAVFAASPDPAAPLWSAALPPDQTLGMFQERAPFYSDPAARSRIARTSAGGGETLLQEGSLAGDWGGLSGPRGGLAVGIRQLWQQFPKEIAVSREAVHALLWSSRGGWDLDLRGDTVRQRVPADWLNRDLQGAVFDQLDRQAGSPVGMARSHELLILLQPPQQPAERTAQVMRGFSEPALVLADPKWLHASGAMGPLSPHDPQRFPEAEAFIDAYFDQRMAVLEQWGDYGFLDFGNRPHVWYHQPRTGPLAGRWVPKLERYAGLDYGMIAHAWQLYARSGDRKYLNFAEPATRHRRDIGMVHWDGPREAQARAAGNIRNSGVLYNRFRGGYAIGSGSSPFHWGRFTQLHHNSGTDLQAFYFQTYLRDDRRSREVAESYRALVLDLWRTGRKEPFNTRPFAILKNLAVLYQETGDSEILAIGRQRLADLTDLSVPQGVTPNLPTGLGKYGVKIEGTYRWFLATGDDLAAQVLLRAARTHATTELGGAALSYYNASASYLSAAWRMTGDPIFLRALSRDLQIAIDSHRDSATGQWQIPVGAAADNVYPMVGVAQVLDVLARHDAAPEPVPALQQNGYGRQTLAIVRKPAGEAITLELRAADPIAPRVLGAGGAVAVQSEFFTEHLGRLDPLPSSARLVIPAGVPAGDYVIDSGVGGGAWEVTWSDARQLVLYAPGGLVTGTRASDRFIRPGSTVVAGSPRWHLRAGSDAWSIFATEAIELNDPAGRAVSLKPMQWNPVAAAPGLWQLRAPQAAFVQVRGALPVFAAHDPQRFFEPDLAALAPALQAAAWPQPAGPAPDQVQVDLSGREQRVIARGAPIEAGRYERFDARQGTLELWIRPNWSSVEQPRQGAGSNRLLLGAGPWNIYLHRFGERNTQLDVRGAKGALSAFSALALEAGQWTHLAWQWQEDAQGYFEAQLFVDGRLQNQRHGSAERPHRVAGLAPYAVAEQMVLGRHGSLDATVSGVRLSSRPRYEHGFTPPAAVAADAHTLWLLAE